MCGVAAPACVGRKTESIARLGWRVGGAWGARGRAPTNGRFGVPAKLRQTSAALPRPAAAATAGSMTRPSRSPDLIQTRTPRRASLAALTASAVLLAGALAPAPAAAQAGYPTKPITLIVPYAAGGFADTRARKLGEKLSKALGVAVVVDNRAGAGGVLGTSLVAKAAPDGYTLGMGNLAPLAVNVSLMKKLPYDPQKDITPIVLIEKAPLILTSSPSLPFATVNDIVAAARAKPGSLTYGSSGIGGAHHLSAAMFAGMWASIVGERACSRRTASSWMRCQGMPITSTRKRSKIGRAHV